MFKPLHGFTITSEVSEGGYDVGIARNDFRVPVIQENVMSVNIDFLPIRVSWVRAKSDYFDMIVSQRVTKFSITVKVSLR